MNEMIPSDWDEVKLGDLLKVICNGTTSKQINEKTPYPVTRIETISDGEINRSKVKYLREKEEDRRLQKGDILYSHINSVKHIGKVAIVEDEKPLYHGMNLMLLRVDQERALPQFVHYVLSSELGRRYARRQAKSAVNQASLNQGQIKGMPVRLPPMSEQRRIAAVLDTVDAALRETDAVIAKQEQVKTGLLQDLLTRGLDADGRLRDPARHPEQFRETELGRIPKEWVIRPLKEMTLDSAPICYGIVQRGKHVEGGVPLVTINDLGGEYGSGLRRCAEEIDAKYERSRIKGGDVLLSVKGSIGEVDVVPSHFRGNISRDIARLRTSDRVMPEYLKAAFAAPVTQKRFWEISVGTTRAELSIGRLKNFPIPVPSMREQKAITRVVSEHERKASSESLYRKKLHSVKNGLMQDLLTGRKRVPEIEAPVAEAVA